MNKWERILIYLLVGITLILSLWALQDKRRCEKRVLEGKASYEKLTIIDSRGKPRIILGSTEGGLAQISLYDHDKTLTAIINNTGISLYAPGLKEQVWIGPRPGQNASGGIELFDTNRQLVAKIGGRKHGGYVDLYSHEGKPLASFGGMEVPVTNIYKNISAGGIVTYGFLGKPIASFGITREGNGSLTLWDKYHKPYLQYPLKLKK